jgi:serine/threonine protein kinase
MAAGATRNWRDALELTAGVADGLAEAHAGILHRDINPQNILVTKSGYAKLADFGLAKLEERIAPEDETRTLEDGINQPGVILGTVAYMSPEQVSGKRLDARAMCFHSAYCSTKLSPESGASPAGTRNMDTGRSQVLNPDTNKLERHVDLHATPNIRSSGFPALLGVRTAAEVP